MTRPAQLTPYGRGRTRASRMATLKASALKTGRVLWSTWRPNSRFQRQVLANDTGIDFVIAGLGGGKSVVGAAKLVRWALANPRRADGSPTRWLVLCKDFRAVKKLQFLKILEVLRALKLPHQFVVKSVVYGEAPTITLWNGVEFVGFSGTNVDSTRGHEFDGIWADEAEYMPAESFLTSLSRLRSVSGEKGEALFRVIVTSSPDGAGWIYQVINGDYGEWAQFREKAEVRVFRFRSEDNPANSKAQLEAIGAALEARRPGLARQEMKGRFLGTSEAPVSGAIEYSRAFVGPIVLAPGEDRAEVVGADLAKSDDFCWFSAVSKDGVVLEMLRFNFGTVDVSREEFWGYARRELMALAYRRGARTIVVDTARGGDVFANALREDIEKGQDPVTAALKARGAKVVEYATDGVGKRSELIEAWGGAVKVGRFKIPASYRVGSAEPVQVADVHTVLMEFKKLQAEELPGGKRKFYPSSGCHDDGIISVGLAWHGLSVLPARAPSTLGGWKQPGGSAPSGGARPKGAGIGAWKQPGT